MLKLPVAATDPSAKNIFDAKIPEPCTTFCEVENEISSPVVCAVEHESVSLDALELTDPETFPFIVIFANVGDEVVAIGCGVDKVIDPGPFVTMTSFDVPVKAAATGACPELPTITSLRLLFFYYQCMEHYLCQDSVSLRFQ